MRASRSRCDVGAGLIALGAALLVVTGATPVRAQAVRPDRGSPLTASGAGHAGSPGNNGHNQPGGPSSGHGHESAPPSRSALPPPTVSGTAAIIPGATPFAWIDDATVLQAGAGALTVSAVAWQGTDAQEFDGPAIGAAVGLTPRLQIGASVPYVVGNANSGVIGGLGTSFVSAKVGLVQEPAVKLAVAPTLEVLGAGVLEGLAPGENRVQWGVPASIEIDRDPVRAYAGGGFFSQGIRFAGGGVSVAASSRVTLSGSVSHAWASASAAFVDATAASDRTELFGGASVALTTHVGVFGSIGHTLATTDANGAGLTIVGGVSFVAAPAGRQ